MARFFFPDECMLWTFELTRIGVRRCDEHTGGVNLSCQIELNMTSGRMQGSFRGAINTPHAHSTNIDSKSHK